MAEAEKVILIIEDDQDIRETVKTILEIEGYTVLTATQGQEGIDLLKRHARLPHLILLDLMMPIMSGWEFLETIHRDYADSLAKIPVVVVSAAGDLARTRQLQVAKFMKKPVDIDALLRSVSEHVA